MYDKNSDYALNKRKKDAIVYISVTGPVFLTHGDFATSYGRSRNFGRGVFLDRFEEKERLHLYARLIEQAKGLPDAKTISVVVALLC